MPDFFNVAFSGGKFGNDLLQCVFFDFKIPLFSFQFLKFFIVRGEVQTANAFTSYSRLFQIKLLENG